MTHIGQLSAHIDHPVDSSLAKLSGPRGYEAFSPKLVEGQFSEVRLAALLGKLASLCPRA
jgi:hypothetical protein